MEYYEESFLKFEESLDFSSIQDDSGCEDLYVKSEFALQKFRKYEKDFIKGDKKKCRRYSPKMNCSEVPEDRVMVEDGEKIVHTKISTVSVAHTEAEQVGNFIV